MLNVYSSGAGSCKIACKFLKRWRILKMILPLDMRSSWVFSLSPEFLILAASFAACLAYTTNQVTTLDPSGILIQEWYPYNIHQLKMGNKNWVYLCSPRESNPRTRLRRPMRNAFPCASICMFSLFRAFLSTSLKVMYRYLSENALSCLLVFYNW